MELIKHSVKLSNGEVLTITEQTECLQIAWEPKERLEEGSELDPDHSVSICDISQGGITTFPLGMDDLDLASLTLDIGPDERLIEDTLITEKHWAWLNHRRPRVAAALVRNGIKTLKVMASDERSTHLKVAGVKKEDWRYFDSASRATGDVWLFIPKPNAWNLDSYNR